MVDGEVDILVCTTIIETGIDIPNVNTLIIEDADQHGPGPAPSDPGPRRALQPGGPTPT
ncbi:MAG: helicase-related protein [Evtepia sp.]